MDALSLSAAAREAPRRTLLVAATETWSLARAARAVAARRAWLTSHALLPGEPVAIEAAPTLGCMLWLLALIEDARPFVPIHPRLTDAEIETMLEDAGTRVVIPAALEPAGDGDATVSSHRSADPESPLAIVYTSGTSGRPKGVVLSRRAFVASAEASCANLGRRDDDRWLLALPPAHVGGLAIVVRALVNRTAIVPWGPERFDALRLADTCAAAHVSLVSLVPTMLHRLLAAGIAFPPSVRAVLLGGAAAPPALLAAAADRGMPVLVTYGLTEACSQVTTQAYGTVQRGEAGVGLPLPGTEVRIRDGRILVRGRTLFSGYHPVNRQPPPFDADGFFDTGDLGAFDAHGNLHVNGRLDDLIVAGGENVHPAEVEQAVLALPDIADACVFGVPDTEWGARVALVVVGVPGTPVDPDAVVAALAHRLARHKLPSLGASAPALPYVGIGKLDRRRAAATFAAELRPLRRPRR